jgi:hypothetical protein
MDNKEYERIIKKKDNIQSKYPKYHVLTIKNKNNQVSYIVIIDGTL